MRMHPVQHILTTTLPALLVFTLPLAASSGGDASATDFPAAVQFELGEAEFAPGDSITIQQVRGTSSTVRTGETICVEGTYTLGSKEDATIALYATTRSRVATPTDPSQMMRVKKGTGTFRLVKTMQQDGYLHVSFYPMPSGSAFGGVYFGQGQWVLKQKGWSYLTAPDRSPDYTTSGSTTGESVILKGPNRALFAYLGEPVERPADMDAAYTKEGLIKAIETAARKAGITVERVKIEDSEFPFLVGVICKEGDFPKLAEQLKDLPDYEYNGCTSTPTHASFNIVPYRAFPSQVRERIQHRLGLRNQIFLGRVSTQE